MNLRKIINYNNFISQPPNPILGVPQRRSDSFTLFPQRIFSQSLISIFFTGYMAKLINSTLDIRDKAIITLQAKTAAELIRLHNSNPDLMEEHFSPHCCQTLVYDMPAEDARKVACNKENLVTLQVQVRLSMAMKCSLGATRTLNERATIRCVIMTVIGYLKNGRLASW